MSEKIIVLVTSGRNDSVDKVKVLLFDDRDYANRYVTVISDVVKKKHWTTAEVISESEVIELSPPEFGV